MIGVTNDGLFHKFNLFWFYLAFACMVRTSLSQRQICLLMSRPWATCTTSAWERQR